MHTRPTSCAPENRGTVYVVMLAVLSIVMTISLSTLINSRTDLAAADRSSEESIARSIARSALELGVDKIKTDPAWRAKLFGDSLIGITTIGQGRLRVRVADPLDSDLLDQYDDSVILFADGQYGQSIQKLSARIDFAEQHTRSLEPVMSRLPINYWTLRELPVSLVDSDKRAGVAASFEGTFASNLTDPNGIYRMPELSAVNKTYYDIPHDPSMELDYGSICLWINPSSTYSGSSLTQVALSKWEWNEPNAMQVAIVCTNGFAFLVTDLGGSMEYINMGSITGDQWHHIAITWGDGGWTTYLNGSLSGSAARTGGFGRTWTSNANQMNWYIGAADDIYRRFGMTTGMGNHFHGKICDFALFAYELDEETIKLLANIPPKPVPAVLDHQSITRVID